MAKEKRIILANKLKNELNYIKRERLEKNTHTKNTFNTVYNSAKVNKLEVKI